MALRKEVRRARLRDAGGRGEKIGEQRNQDKAQLEATESRRRSSERATGERSWGAGGTGGQGMRVAGFCGGRTELHGQARASRRSAVLRRGQGSMAVSALGGGDG